MWVHCSPANMMAAVQSSPTAATLWALKECLVSRGGLYKTFHVLSCSAKHSLWPLSRLHWQPNADTALRMQDFSGAGWTSVFDRIGGCKLLLEVTTSGDSA